MNVLYLFLWRIVIIIIMKYRKKYLILVPNFRACLKMPEIFF